MALGSAAVVVAVVLTVKAWPDPKPKTVPRPARIVSPTKEERDWLTKLNSHLSWLDDARLDQYFLVREGCSDHYDESVGEPPTARLQDYQEIAGAACDRIEHGMKALARDPLEGATDYRSAQKEIEEGRRYLIVARSLAGRPHSSSQTSSVDRLLSRAATAVAREPVEVRCWKPKNWQGVMDRAYPDSAGIADFTEHRIHLAPEICTELERLRKYREPSSAGSFALGVLSHEIVHMHPAVYYSEAVVECYGMQGIRRTARALRLPAKLGNALAEMYWREIYPDNDAEYRSTACRPGGRLDRTPSRPAWP